MGAPATARKSAEIPKARPESGDDLGKYAGRAVRGSWSAERIGRRQDSADGHSRLPKNPLVGDRAGAHRC